MRGLTGKVFIIAGAGDIGEAAALRLAEEGAAVVIGNRTESKATGVAERITARGYQAASCALDITDEDAVDACVQFTLDTFGRIDGLHGNAADTRREVNAQDFNILDESMEVFDQTLNVNLRGLVLCTRAVLPHLLEQGGGSIVYTSSGAAYTAQPDKPAYAISKVALHGLIRHIASKWGKQGVRANAVVTGFVMTDAVYRLTTPEYRDFWLDQARSPRLGKPEDIGAMVAMLMSDDGAWINGQPITVDGGTWLQP